MTETQMAGEESQRALVAEMSALETGARAAVAHLLTADGADPKELVDFVRDQIKPRIKRAQAFFKPMKEKAKAAHQEVCDKEKEVLGPLQAAEKISKEGLAEWTEREAAAAREEEARLAREAVEEQERAALAEAALLENAGMPEEADAVIEDAVTTPAPMPAVRQRRAAGVSVPKRWKGRVLNMKALAKAVAEGRVPANALKPNESAINQAANAARGDLQWPGVETYPESHVRVTGR